VRRALAVLVGLVVTVASILLLAGPASAHASLETSDPANGAVLTQPPSQIVLGFDESVDIALGAIRLYDGRGHEIDVGAAHHQGDNAHVAVSVPKLADDAYVVSWRVVSADSHPVHGAFTFQVGTGAAVRDPGLISRLLAQEGGNPTASAPYDRNRLMPRMAPVGDASGWSCGRPSLSASLPAWSRSASRRHTHRAAPSPTP